METNINFWLENANSLNHQLFMIVMGILYAIAFVFGVSYKAINIYVYFILYPTSFALFLKHRIKYFIILSSLLFFTLPNFEALSVCFFDKCVLFLNFTAKECNSDYIRMSIYLCVYVPLVIYLPFLYLTLSKSTFWKYILISVGIIVSYILFLSPFFKDLLLFVTASYRV